MRALGIDPGSRVTGWGVVDRDGARFRHCANGVIALAVRESLGARLATLHAECVRLLDEWRPAVVVLERNFVARNVQSAFRIGEARGVVLAASAAAGVALQEYAPATVKLAAAGHGGAGKDAVGRSISAWLGLARRPPADAADALALALFVLQQAPLAAAIARATRVSA